MSEIGTGGQPQFDRSSSLPVGPTEAEKKEAELLVQASSKKMIIIYEKFKEQLDHILDIGKQIQIFQKNYPDTLKKADAIIKKYLKTIQEYPSDQLPTSYGLGFEEAKIQTEFRDLFLREWLPEILQAQKEDIKTLLQEQEDELADGALERFDALFDVISKQRLQAISKRIKSAPFPHQAIDEEMRKIRYERDVFVEFIAKEIKEYKELEHLYMGGGVCYGACINYAADRIHDKPEKVFPLDSSTRYYQAAHNIYDQLYTAEKRTNKALDKYREQCDLFSKQFASLTMRERCLEAHRLIISGSKLIGNYRKAAKYTQSLQKLLQMKLLADSNYTDLANQLVNTSNSIHAIVHKNPMEKFYKKLGIEVTEIQYKNDKPIKIEKFLNAIESLIADKGLSHTILGLEDLTKSDADDKVKETDSALAHAIYKSLVYVLEGRVEFPTADCKTLFDLLKKQPTEDLKDAIAVFKLEYKKELLNQTVTSMVGSDPPKEVRRMAEKKMKKLTKSILKDLTKTKVKKHLDSDNHAVYCHMQPPYALCDPNFPDFMKFETNDFDEFLLYFAFWNTIHPEYTHSDRIWQVRKIRA